MSRTVSKRKLKKILYEKLALLVQEIDENGCDDYIRKDIEMLGFVIGKVINRRQH